MEFIMGENSKIEWTDHTFNAWIGCQKVSPGCANCYAEALMDLRYGKVKWGPNGERKVTSDANWKLPLRWNRQAEKEGVRRRVFCCSLADVFEGRPEVIFWREELFRLIDSTPHLDWLLLTKRPENIVRMWPGEARKNVWLYTSIENQECSDERIPHLLKCRDLVPVLGLSVEPLLGPIDLLIDGECSDWHCTECRSRNLNPEAYTPADDFKQFKCHDCKHIGDPGDEPDWLPLIDHVIIGGESGPKARVCHHDWIRDIVRQCKAAGVPVFVKQLGTWQYIDYGGTGDAKTSSHVLDRDKGGNPAEWPEDLRIREMPAV